MKTIKVNKNEYEILKLIGHGKGGYSYLAKRDSKLYVLKQIHHEPCDYYEFTDKFDSEVRDYERLVKTIPNNIPHLVEADKKREIIVKDYIEGKTIDFCVLNEIMEHDYYDQIVEISNACKNNGFNIDYFPTNFIAAENGKIYYIDFEVNEYMSKWNYENWGKKYWYRTDEFIEFFLNSNTELITERLLLRKLCPDDLNLVDNGYMTQFEIGGFLTVDPVDNKKNVLTFMEHLLRDPDNTKLKWSIILQENKQVIGCIEITRRDNNGISHIDYILSKDYWNQGYMSEALNAIIEKTFQRGINIVAIEADEGNVAANMVALKNGFELVEVVEEEDRFKPGHIINVNHYIKRK